MTAAFLPRDQRTTLVQIGARWIFLAAVCAAACGDTEATPLYAAPQAIAPDAHWTETGAEDAASDAPWTVRPCTAGQPLVLSTTTPSSVARPGAVFSAPPISEYRPRAVTVRLTTASDVPVPGCDIAWTPAAGSGWVFPLARSTDSEGTVDAWWTAGPDATQTLLASVVARDGAQVSTTLSGTTEARRTIPPRVYLDYVVDAFDDIGADVVPLLAPAQAYIGVVYTTQCGASLVNDASPDGQDGGALVRQISAYCWNSSSDDAVVIDSALSTCASDGDGMRCSRPYPWKLGGSYRFESQTKRVVADHIDYVFYFTDLETGERSKLAELRYGGTSRQDFAYSYLRGYAFGASCLMANQLYAQFSNVRATDGATEIAVKSATFSRDYILSNDWICANYAYGATGDAFFLSAGGERVGPPRVPGGPVPAITLP